MFIVVDEPQKFVNGNVVWRFVIAGIGTARQLHLLHLEQDGRALTHEILIDGWRFRPDEITFCYPQRHKRIVNE